MSSVSCSTWTIILCLIHYCKSQTTASPTNLPTAKPTTSPTLPYTASECSVSFDTVSASFNLCPLTIGEGGGQIKYYKVQDNRFVNKTTTTNSYTYDYYFNVAAAIQEAGVPPICANTSYKHRYCPDDTDCSGDNNTISINGTAWSYQVRVDSETGKDDECIPLSNENGGPPEWALIDELDPSLGVQLIYRNGQYTDATECKSNRKFNIRFECEDNVRFIPDEIPLYEYTPCEYTLTVPSQYGCPIECKIYDNQLCSSHGLCGFDNTNDASRCFCFNAYVGDDCSIHDTNSSIPDDAAKPVPDSNYYAFKFPNALDTGVNVTYDLSPFGADNSHAAQNGGIYIVHDKDFDTNTDRLWTYYVAITTLLDPTASDSILPDSCKSIQAPCNKTIENGTCTEFESDNEKQWSGQGLVFQVNNDTDNPECYVLGRGFPSTDLYDKIDDPARGVTVMYSGGSWCENAKRNREFRVNLVCPRDQTAIFDPYEETEVDLYEYVEEEEICIYSLTMESAIACPYQCITNTTDAENKEAFTVCSRQGICAADPEAGFVRCLCDNGWKGVYCSEIDSPNPTLSPTQSPINTSTPITKSKTGFVAVIVILIIIILVVCGVGYFIYRNQKMKISQQEDEIAFHKMTDKGMVGKDAVQTNVITDENTGKRGFQTIDTTKQQDDDEDDVSD